MAYEVTPINMAESEPGRKAETPSDSASIHQEGLSLPYAELADEANAEYAISLSYPLLESSDYTTGVPLVHSEPRPTTDADQPSSEADWTAIEIPHTLHSDVVDVQSFVVLVERDGSCPLVFTSAPVFFDWPAPPQSFLELPPHSMYVYSQPTHAHIEQWPEDIEATVSDTTSSEATNIHSAVDDPYFNSTADKFPGVIFSTYYSKTEVNHYRGTSIKGQGIEVNISPDAIKEDCDIFIYGCIDGPFEVPEDICAASPVFLISCTHPSSFEDTITLKLKHFIHFHDWSYEDCSAAMVLLTSPDVPLRDAEGEHYWRFNIDEHSMLQCSPNTMIGEVHIKHFSFLCLGIFTTCRRRGNRLTVVKLYVLYEVFFYL